MLKLGRGRLAIKYIFFELLPTFLFAVAGFIFLITMVQTFKLGEYIIVHGAKLGLVANLMVYMILSFLPVIFPMALLLSVLLTYGRLSQDSEIVALKSLGLGISHIATPAIVLGVIATFFSAQVSFNLAPWGHRKLDELVHEMSNYRPMATIREGVFSEGFFDLVVYANKVDSKNGSLKKIFIFEERSGTPLTIIAREGQLLTESEGLRSRALLRLYDGNVHRSANEFYTKIDFETYDINLFDRRDFGQRSYGADTLTMNELMRELKKPDLPADKRIDYRLEWHRRWSMALMAAIFALIGVGLGTVTNRRQARAGGIVLSISVIVLYWIGFVIMENLARKQILPLGPAVWSINIISLIFGIRFLKRAANT